MTSASPTLHIQALLEQLIHALSIDYRRCDRGEILRDVLDLDLLRVSSLEKGAYEQPEDKNLWHPWVLRIADGSLHSLQTARRAGPAKTIFKTAVEDYLTGRKPAKTMPIQVPSLPSIAARVLEHDSLVPKACEQLGLLARRFILIANGKHHQASLAGDKWKAVKVYAANDPEIFVGNESVTVHLRAGEGAKQGLQGKMLIDVIDHPAFADYRIRLVTTRPTGMTLRVEKVAS